MAFELTDTNPFATSAFTLSGTKTDSLSFSTDFETRDFNSWKANFERNLPDFTLNLKEPKFSSNIASAAMIPTTNSTTGYIDAFGNVLMGMKSEGDKALTAGYAIKTAAAAGELFTNLLTVGDTWANANKQASNTEKNVENQMLAIDNQVLYYKNQIADKFNQTMARNAVTMAAKNLRVTAANLLEQTKGAATEATEDIQMAESNAKLKKIALESESRQAQVAKKLTKSMAIANVIGSAAKLGLIVSGGIEAGVDYGKLFE